MDNLRVYYLVRNNKFNKNDLGFFNKFYGQIEAVIKAGFDLTFVYSENNSLLAENYHNSIIEKFTISEFRFLFFKHLLFYNSIEPLFKETPPDVIYLRYKISDITFILFLKKVKRMFPGCKIFLEFPTFPYDLNWKQESIIKKILLPMDRYFRKKLKRYINYAVTYTAQEQIFNIDALNIENGISLKEIPVKKRKEFPEEQFSLIAVAGLGYWHGYDRVIKGIYEHKKKNKKKNILFHIVGDGKEKTRLIDLAQDLDVKDSIIFHGSKTGKELDIIFNSAHVAVSTIGWHRMGIKKSSTLKSREYCARGIPFIMEGEDDGFIGNFPFLYKIVSDETAVNIDDIIGFYNSIKIKEYSHLMRKYAEENFSWHKKLGPVTKKFK